MTEELSRTDRAVMRPADGTVKQHNPLTGTEVWTVPGRDNRPLSVPHPDPLPIDHSCDGHHYAFCNARYLETPPEKSRLVIGEDGSWHEITGFLAERLSQQVTEFRRIPDLFEIVSYNYWHLDHGHTPSESEHRHMAKYLTSLEDYEHIIRVVRTHMLASGASAEGFEAMEDFQRFQQANSFFSDGHDLIVARHHYVDGAMDTTTPAGSGTFTPEEHYQYTAFTARTMSELYGLDEHVRYVATFQNWLKPAGAPFDHLHKQLVAVDDLFVQAEAGLNRLCSQPGIYDEILKIAATRRLFIAQNEHAIAVANFDHRFPGVAIWPLCSPKNPWELSEEQTCSVSDLLHVMHVATDVNMPYSKEWYRRPPPVRTPMRFRIPLKWRISTLAGSEDGTRIYLNTISPWDVVNKLVPHLLEMREADTIAPMKIGKECRVSPEVLSD